MTKILRWLRRLFTKPTTILRYGAVIKDFKDDPARVRAMATIYHSPTFQLALSVVATSAPPFETPPKDGTQAAFALGVARGVRDTISMLKFLGEADVQYEELKPDWGIPDDIEIESPRVIYEDPETETP